MGHDGAGHDNAMRQRAVLHGGKLNAGGLDLICRQLNVHLLIVDAFGPGFASRPALLAGLRRFACAHPLRADERSDSAAYHPWNFREQARDDDPSCDGQDRNGQSGFASYGHCAPVSIQAWISCPAPS
jgi:hypothetical protein